MSSSLDDDIQARHRVVTATRPPRTCSPGTYSPGAHCCSVHQRSDVGGTPMSAANGHHSGLFLAFIILSSLVNNTVFAASRTDHQALQQPSRVVDNPVTSSRHVRDLSKEYSARSGVMRCHVTTCWDSYHSAVDISLLVVDDGDSFVENDDASQQSLTSSSRSYDRLTMTSTFCSRQVSTSSRRPPKRLGKTASRKLEGLSEDRKRRVIESTEGGSAEHSNGTDVSSPSQRDHRIVGGVDEVPRRPSTTGNHADASRRRLCKALRALINCIELSVDGCRGMLSYHSSRRLARSNLDRCNCTNDDNEADEFDDSAASNGDKRKDVENRQDPDDVMLNDRAATEGRRVDDVTSDSGSTISDSCRYGNSARGGDHSVCVVYGDPHVRTFDGSFQTCRSVGTWPLIDNDYLTVQTTNIRMGRNGGTAISKVSVIVKPYLDCSAPPGRYLTYLAEEGRLPSDWGSDSPALDVDLVEESPRTGGSGLLIDEIDPGEHVEIYLAYIDTTVSLKLVGCYYSVSISTPPELHQQEFNDDDVTPTTPNNPDIVSTRWSENAAQFPVPVRAANATNLDEKTRLADTASDEHSLTSRDRQLSGHGKESGNRNRRRESGDFEMCVRGCPHRETVNLVDYFQRERWRSGRSAGPDIRRTGRTGALPMVSASSMPFMSVEAARSHCVTDGHLVGYLIDSCVFDLLNTGDMSFSMTAARGAMVDLRRFTGSSSHSSSLFGTSLVGDRSPLVPDSLLVVRSSANSIRLFRSFFSLATCHLFVVFFATRWKHSLKVSRLNGDLAEHAYSTR